MSSKNKGTNFLAQGTILAAAAMITKVVGLAYRIPLTNIMGSEGNGYYGVVFQVYSLALMLTSYSLPMAVSKLVSARVSTGQYKNAYRVFKGAMSFGIVSGGIVTAIVFFGAGFISEHILKMGMSVYALRVLAPCILIVAILGVLRGFFQGYGTMIPTAVSQVAASTQLPSHADRAGYGLRGAEGDLRRGVRGCGRYAGDSDRRPDSAPLPPVCLRGLQDKAEAADAARPDPPS